MCFTLHFLYFDIAIFEWLVHINQLKSIETCNNVCHNTHKKSFLLCLSPNIILEKRIIKYKIESMLLNGRKIEFMSLSAWQMELFSLFFFLVFRNDFTFHKCCYREITTTKQPKNKAETKKKTQAFQLHNIKNGIWFDFYIDIINSMSNGHNNNI